MSEHEEHAQATTDWDALFSALPTDVRTAFDKTIRQTLKNRIRREARSAEKLPVPDSVRAHAVGQWRSTYMAKASKAARRRRTYETLRDEPTYQEIERKLMRRHLMSRLPPRRSRNFSAQFAVVDQMTRCEACEAYRAAKPQIGSTPTDLVAYDVVRAACRREIEKGEVANHIAEQVLGVVRTDRLGRYVHVRDDGTRGATPQDGTWKGAIDLSEVVSEQDVRERVATYRLVDRIVMGELGKPSAYLLARGALIDAALAHPETRATCRVMRELFGSAAMARPTLLRLAKQGAKAIDAYLQGEEFAGLIAHELVEGSLFSRRRRQMEELRLRVRENVPETPMEAYPLARTMRRRFIVHVGPTNSGKTHDAMDALLRAASGVYLGPLRLLAYEQFEYLNGAGCPCSLVTGEEAIEVAGATHTSSTVEMANFSQRVDVAVIDEAQMIADANRGFHWTAAILGIPAREVHVCCAAHAERIVTQLVQLCDDDVRVVRHERLVPLRLDTGDFAFPGDVRRGDALIVFSRRAVHATAAVIAARGIRPSLVYGALPYSVRHEEARKFNAGETDVVVATDAIGMGMNLPIARIVFMEQEKYDGHTQRPLTPDEIQQIAGRAGRYGRYGEGLYQSVGQKDLVARRYAQAVDEIASIPVGLPDDIALVRDATLSESIRQWMSIEQPLPFERIDLTRDLHLIDKVESKVDEEARRDVDTKQMVLSLATMAFDEGDHHLYRMWRKMVDAELAGTTADLAMPEAPDRDATLAAMEASYRRCDLLYSYARTFSHDEGLDDLVARRDEIARAIMDRLGSATGAPRSHA